MKHEDLIKDVEIHLGHSLTDEQKNTLNILFDIAFLRGQVQGLNLIKNIK